MVRWYFGLAATRASPVHGSSYPFVHQDRRLQEPHSFLRLTSHHREEPRFLRGTRYWFTSPPIGDEMAATPFWHAQELPQGACQNQGRRRATQEGPLLPTQVGGRQAGEHIN